MKRHMIGAEAEFLLLFNGKPITAFDATKGEPGYNPTIPHDAFDLLAEIRGRPYEHAGAAYGDFLEEKDRVESWLKDGVRLTTKEYRFPVDFYWENVTRCSVDYKKNKSGVVGGNIFGNALKHSSRRGYIKRGGGLHIHFSEDELRKDKDGNDTRTVTFIPIAVIESVIKRVEKEFKPMMVGFENSYRQPGFWRRKEHGFEMRSLPCSDSTIANLRLILTIALSVFKDEMTRRS